MAADDIIVTGVIIRELEKEGVGLIQAARIAKAVIKAVEAFHARTIVAERHNG